MTAMTTTTFQLYDALKAAGVDEPTARAAAQTVLTIADREQLATKADLADLRVEFYRALRNQTIWLAGIILAGASLSAALTAVFLK